MEIKVKANGPQSRFLPMPQKFRAFIGGFGSSKTYSGCMAMCQHFWEHPGVNQGYFSPTYPSIRDIFYPTIEEVAFAFGFNVEIKQTAHEVHFYNGREYRGTTICRSMDKPGNIIGFKIGHALIDELDTLPINKAEEAWQKIIARMRYKVDGVRNGIDVASTPEGFRFCHKKFVQLPQENPDLLNNYGLVQASTYENAKYLPDDYIPSLIESYPKELIEAYLMGQFVNLTSGSVYPCYDRKRCNSNETIKPLEPLLIGIDFNIGMMAASILVQRPNGYHIAAELHDVFDTPAIARIITERWKAGDDKDRKIIIYPDASGKSRHTSDASKSDFAILQQAGFQIKANPSNPFVRDRVLAVNKQFEIGRLFVNSKECPTVTRCLEQQSYNKDGEPDKTSNFDHQNDATGYPIAYEKPIIRPMTRMQIIGI